MVHPEKKRPLGKRSILKIRKYGPRQLENKKAWLTRGKRATSVCVWRLVFAISTLFYAPSWGTASAVDRGDLKRGAILLRGRGRFFGRAGKLPTSRNPPGDDGRRGHRGVELTGLKQTAGGLWYYIAHTRRPCQVCLRSSSRLWHDGYYWRHSSEFLITCLPKHFYTVMTGIGDRSESVSLRV